MATVADKGDRGLGGLCTRRGKIGFVPLGTSACRWWDAVACRGMAPSVCVLFR